MDNTKVENPLAFAKTGTFNEVSESQFDSENQDGMTLRDYFAAKAMVATISAPESKAIAFKTAEEAGCGVEELVANMSYALADAMLRERMHDNPNRKLRKDD